MPDLQSAITLPDDIVAAVLVLSRVVVSKADSERARSICRNVSDWSLLTDVATRKFSLPFVHRNLSRLFPDGEMDRTLEMMRADVRQMQMASLRVISAQAAFHRICLEPIGVRHAYLKGPALAHVFYDNPGMRYCRDVDVLVPEEALSSIFYKAVESGYKVVDTLNPSRLLTHSRDWRALLRYSPVAILLSPEGVPIELHKEIDKNLGVFDAEDFMNDPATIRIGEMEMQTVSAEKAFCFVCYHNSRHLWSRLHWLTDLSAMLAHPALDLDRARNLAKTVGLEPTIEACVEMNRLASTGHTATQTGKSHGKQLLDQCTRNFGGDLELERELRGELGNQALPFRWLITGAARRRARRRALLRRIGPSFEQYQAWPLPDGLQWLYYPSKPLFSVLNRLRGKRG